MTVCSLTSQSTKKKSVRWVETCVQISIIHYRDMPQEETQGIWYSRDDYKAFRRDCQNTVQILKNENRTISSGVSQKDDICERGLETVSSAYIRIRRQRRKRLAMDNVLGEQSFQRYEGQGYNLPDSIARSYQTISAPCHNDAYMQGLQDEKEARDCHGEAGDEASRLVLMTRDAVSAVDRIRVPSLFHLPTKMSRSHLQRRRARTSFCAAA